MVFMTTEGQTIVTAFGKYHCRPILAFGQDSYSKGTMIMTMSWGSQWKGILLLSIAMTRPFMFTTQELERSFHWIKYLYALYIVFTTHKMNATSIIMIYTSTTNPPNVIGQFHTPLYKRGGSKI